MDNNIGIPALPAIVFRNGRAVEINDSFLELTEYKREELLNNTLDELEELLKCDFISVKNLGTASKEYFIFTKSLVVKHVRINFHDCYEKDEIVITLDNIHGDDRVNNDILNLIDIMDLPIIRISFPDFKLISVNDKAIKIISSYYNMLAPHPKDIVGKNINDVISSFGLNTHLANMPDAEKLREPLHIRDYKISNNGQDYYINIIHQPIFNTKNELVEIVVTFFDVTSEIKKKNELESVLKRQEEYFNYMAHEFKTPLTITYSAIQLLDFFCSSELSDRAKGFINKIRQSSLQQIRLVNNILDITKAEAGYLKLNARSLDLVFLTNAIVNSVSIFAQERGIAMHFISAVPEKLVLIDDEKYERILLNLLSNSIKFTPQGKSIYVDLTIDNNNVNIRIKDEGSGIPKDKQKLIFERFGQVNDGLIRNGEGTGIGLCLAKMLAKALNGDITLESEVGKGSTFTIILPEMVPSDSKADKITRDVIEDRLVQSLSIEFSNIYQ